MSKKSAYFTLNRIDGKHDVKEIKHEIDMLPGVSSVSINTRSDFLGVDFDTTGVGQEQIKKQIEKLGYEVIKVKTDDEDIR